MLVAALSTRRCAADKNGHQTDKQAVRTLITNEVTLKKSTVGSTPTSWAASVRQAILIYARQKHDSVLSLARYQGTGGEPLNLQRIQPPVHDICNRSLLHIMEYTCYSCHS